MSTPPMQGYKMIKRRSLAKYPIEYATCHLYNVNNYGNLKGRTSKERTVYRIHSDSDPVGPLTMYSGEFNSTGFRIQ